MQLLMNPQGQHRRAACNQVGPKIWLGRASVGGNMTSTLLTKAPDALTQPLLDVLRTLSATTRDRPSVRATQGLTDEPQVRWPVGQLT